MTSPDHDCLADVARILYVQSAESCAESCRSYHAVWGFLRLFGSLPSVGRDHDALLARISTLASKGAERVLVSGAADCGILAYVIAGFERAGVAGSVHVTDQCPTPLEANRWYGEHAGWPIETSAGDIRTFVGRDFDLVVGHNFFNFFEPSGRFEVARAWHDALRPGGAVLLFAHVKPGGPERSRRFGPDRTDQLVDDMLRRRDSSSDRSIVDADELETLVRRYARQHRSQHVRRNEDLLEPLQHAGLRVESVEEHAASREAIPSDTSGHRVSVVARRPLGSTTPA